VAELVALYSHRPGSGKSTAAAALAQGGWAVVPFAAPLKLMAVALLEVAGYGRAEARELLATGKQERLWQLAEAPTGRHLLQTLGTDWGRELIHPRLWIELWEDRVKELLAQGRQVVCDDLRTPEEMAAIQALGGQVWLVERPEGAIADAATVAHATEGALAAATFDRVVVNNGSQAAFEALVRGQQLVAPSRIVKT
jgi:hypothetical protein